jgi:hypothetical protein
MQRMSVLLVYEPSGGNPLTITRIADTTVVSEVARVALDLAQAKAEALRPTVEKRSLRSQF